MGRRDKDPKDKQSLSRGEFLEALPTILAEIQTNIYDKALEFRKEHTKEINSLEELKDFFKQDKEEIHGGFALCYVSDNDELEDKLKEMKLTHRCTPLNKGKKLVNVFLPVRKLKKRSVIAKAY